MEPLFAVGALLAMIGIVFHLVYGAIKRGDLTRNRAVGIRTRSTMQSEEAWREGHRAAAPIILASVLVAYFGAALCLAVELLTQGQVNEALVGAIVATSLGSFLILTLYAARVANKAARGASRSH